MCLASAGAITQYTDRTIFNTAVGSNTVEDFTSTTHFPILGLTLNSFTNDPSVGIAPGDIKAGVTYSTSLGVTANESDPFNIDGGIIYTGGFLDSRTRDGGSRPLTATFTGPVTAFGFDTEGFFISSYSITINFTSGPNFVTIINPANDNALHFFGFKSSAQDIASVLIAGGPLNGSGGTATSGFV